ncbi:hypothetical protein EV360DRAFT_75289 [Lentinula raphanica]|nr:hypothetical protein EV360DRAFT_75289 [Lentinula raphanica]
MVLKASQTLLMTLLISWHFLIYKFCIDKGDHATIQARVGQSVPHLSSTLPIFSIRYLGDETMTLVDVFLATFLIADNSLAMNLNRSEMLTSIQNILVFHALSSIRHFQVLTSHDDSQNKYYAA